MLCKSNQDLPLEIRARLSESAQDLYRAAYIAEGRGQRAEGRRQKVEAKIIKGFAVSAQPNGFNN